MKFKSWNETREIELKDCPFCGGEPEVKHFGNDHTKMRKIEVKCKKCRCKKVNATLRNGFSWLEDVTKEDWNQRPKPKNSN